MTAESLAGRHAIVTGASRGIGAATAAELARRGARVTLLGREVAALDATAASIAADHPSAETLTIACDVAVPERIPAAVREATDRLGAPHILVNNAGQGAAASFLETGQDVWDTMFAVNLNGPVHCIRAVLPAMLEQGHGRIVNVASMAGLKGYGRTTAYTASKHAIVGLTRALALEVRRRGITVNAVCPGYTDTAMATAAQENVMRTTGKSVEEARALILRVNPRGELIRPAEVAQVIAWLCGDAAAGISGQAIPVAGGEM